MSDAWCDQCDRYYDPSKEHDCRVMVPEEAQANRLPHAWRPAWKRAAEAGGSLRGDGAEGTITIKAEAGTVHIDRPHIATLPTGERVDLPAGTVLREGMGGVDPTKLLQRIKDLQDDRARQHAEIERLRAQIETSATPADRAVGAAMLGSLR